MDTRLSAGVEVDDDGGVRVDMARSPSKRNVVLPLLLLLGMLLMSTYVVQRSGDGGAQGGLEASTQYISSSSSSSSLSKGGGGGNVVATTEYEGVDAELDLDLAELGEMQEYVDRRSLISADDLIIFNSTVVVDQKVVLRHTARSPFDTSSMYCSTAIRNILFHPKETVIFYILDESCYANVTNKRVRSMHSYWKANLSTVAMEMWNGTEAEPVLLSNWWSSTEKTTKSIKKSTVVGDTGSMALVYGMDILENAEQLVLGATTEGEKERSKLVFMDTTTGNRVSNASTNVANVDSLAFNPNRTQLYVTDQLSPFVSLYSIPWTADDNANLSKPRSFKQVGSFVAGGEPDIRDMNFRRQSFDPTGNCLYSVENGKIWAVEPMNGKAPTLLAGGGVSKSGEPEDGNHN
ncbi:hypothetical protein CBR_g22105 [Chara braunii]|uniref:Uncharacterized protein n=1 Tax=Chara braunii TaxID=69332 RepID=A0A388L267_CHABU|nr:hypothetical protein CBR_g22105 [Chara braunii]|eukprot:GBG76358.1 hypothetical protein CBR_g22105 [Chara braunii]